MRVFLKYIKFVLIFGEFHTGYLDFIHPLLFAPTLPRSNLPFCLFSFSSSSLFSLFFVFILFIYFLEDINL